MNAKVAAVPLVSGNAAPVSRLARFQRVADARPRRPLKVGVLVDLAFRQDAGGHVKCWQRLAEAAVDFPERLDLTVHFSGREARDIPLSPSVRYALLPPLFSTARLIGSVPDHTDLAPWHPQLAKALARYDVIHTTDAYFCYARTALRVARRRGVPVVSSIHTNTPEYARITTAKLIERTFGRGFVGRIATDRLALPDWVGYLFERRLARYLGAVNAAIGGFTGPAGVCDWRGGGGVRLRRGLDDLLFSPERRDRTWFERRFALPAGALIAMYAGKLDAGKNVPLLAPVIRAARDAGAPLHLFCAGSGRERARLETALGPAVTCAGPLSQDELARAYASADLFLFPSEIDEFGNAALEALASGLPTLVARGSGFASQMADCSAVRVLPGEDPGPWAAAVVELAIAPLRRLALGKAARAYVETRVPSWGEVLEQDLLPIWLEAVASRKSIRR